MSPIKCSFCQYRNFHPGDMCINCGAPLSSQAPTERPISPKNRPSLRNTPSLSREEYILDSSPLPEEEERVPRKEPASTKKPLSRNKPSLTPRSIPRQDLPPTNEPLSRETAPLDTKPLLSRNKPSLTPRSIPRQDPPTNEPLSREIAPLDTKPLLSRNKPSLTPRSIPRQDLPPINKPLSREAPPLDTKPLLPRNKPSLTPRSIPRQDLPPTNKPLPRETPPLDTKPLLSRNKPSLTPRSIPRQDLPPTNKPLPRETPPLDTKPLPRKRSYSKIEAESEAKAYDELYPESEPYLEDEQYPKHESYASNDPYLVNQSYSDGEPYSDGESYSKELIPYQQNLPANYGQQASSSGALEPYQSSTAMQEYLPTSLLPDLSAFVKEGKQASPKPWETDKLPWGLPRRDPDVGGTIIQIQQSQELPDYPNLVLGIVNMLTELIWLIPNDTMKKEEERLQITTVRIRTSNDEKKDARLIGYLRGANLTLGDDVWFWGWHRQGSLTVRKGYNWTSKAVVNTHSMGLVVPAIILLILVGIGFLLFLAAPSIITGLHILR